MVCSIQCNLRYIISTSPVDVDTILFSISARASRVILKMKRLKKILAVLQKYVCILHGVISAEQVVYIYIYTHINRENVP